MTEQSGTTPTPGDPPSTGTGRDGLTDDESTTPGPPTGSDAPSDAADDDPLEGRGHA